MTGDNCTSLSASWGGGAVHLCRVFLEVHSVPLLLGSVSDEETYSLCVSVCLCT